MNREEEEEDEEEEAPTPTPTHPPTHHTHPQQAARLRKEALANGTYGGFDPAKGGGWDPAWDGVEAPKVLRPPKLHARERDREER